MQRWIRVWNRIWRSAVQWLWWCPHHDHWWWVEVCGVWSGEGGWAVSGSAHQPQQWTQSSLSPSWSVQTVSSRVSKCKILVIFLETCPNLDWQNVSVVAKNWQMEPSTRKFSTFFRYQAQTHIYLPVPQRLLQPWRRIFICKHGHDDDILSQSKSKTNQEPCPWQIQLLTWRIG